MSYSPEPLLLRRGQWSLYSIDGETERFWIEGTHVASVWSDGHWEVYGPMGGIWTGTANERKSAKWLAEAELFMLGEGLRETA